MQLSEHTSTKTNSESSAPNTIGGQRNTAEILQHVSSGFSEFGKVVQDIGEQFIVALRRAFVQLTRHLCAFQRCLRVTVRKPMRLQVVKAATAYTPPTGNILASFKRVTTQEVDMDSRGTHMFSPNQHITISWIADAIGHPGHVSRDAIFQCLSAKYTEDVVLTPGKYAIMYDPSKLYDWQTAVYNMMTQQYIVKDKL